MIEHAYKLHLYAAFVQFAAECRTCLSMHQGDRDAVSLFAKADSLIKRANSASHGSGRGDKESSL